MTDSNLNPSHDKNLSSRENTAGTWSILVASAARDAHKMVDPIVREMNCAVHFAQTHDEVMRLVSTTAFDAAIVDANLTEGNGLELIETLRATPASPCVIVTCEDASADMTIECVRRGACDVIRSPLDPGDVLERLGAALENVRSERRRDRKIARLRTICRRLNKARHEVSVQVDELCTDLVVAYQELADQMSNTTLASEFAAMVRQELDIESLLRSVLETMLARTGPTNAAVFLPSGHNDFNLGAYVNQTLHGESVDVLLDHLADVIPGEFENESQIVRIEERAEQWDWVLEEADWLAGSSTVVFSCIQEDECLAVVMLFRPESQPFTDELLTELAIMQELFAEQLDRIVRVHHRTASDQENLGFDIDADDEDPDEFGDSLGDWSGGMAA